MPVSHTWKRSLNPIPFIPEVTSSVRRVRVAFSAPPERLRNDNYYPMIKSFLKIVNFQRALYV